MPHPHGAARDHHDRNFGLMARSASAGPDKAMIGAIALGIGIDY
jgi:hypothetical protein